MGGISLNVSLELLLMLNMCQCLFIISFIFGSTRLYVTCWECFLYSSKVEHMRLILSD